mmetsp:Transcript_45130/g.118397  ORF Transcript_45130/g.118397 Transcript_45130/m.118397 type:complete len:439 (+) Transcript_45130:81-1397(+)
MRNLRCLLILMSVPYAQAEASCLEGLVDLKAAQKSFAQDGFAVLRGFADDDEVKRMRSSMESMVEEWWQNEQREPEIDSAVFTTGSNQTNAQAKSRYFFESADRIHFFREAGSPASSTDGMDAHASHRPPLNKVGHGLHLDPASPFGAYSRSARVAAVARHIARLKAPVLVSDVLSWTRPCSPAARSRYLTRPLLDSRDGQPQSMYIFKEAQHGGAVTSHQDGTFLYTRPRQTVVGLWLALDDAHTGNGCLWARRGSHHEPLRRRFVRTVDEQGDTVMTFVNTSDKQSESFLHDILRTGSPPPRDGRQWWRRLVNWIPRRLMWSSNPWPASRRALERSRDAREWEGVWPADNTAAGTEAGIRASEDLAARGFVPIEVRAGDLVVFPGTLDHLSLPNGSPHARHTFQLHMVEGPGAGVEWASENWLQLPTNATEGFLRI